MRTHPSRCDTSPISFASLRGQGRTFCSLPAAEVPCGYVAGLVYADPSVTLCHLPTIGSMGVALFVRLVGTDIQEALSLIYIIYLRCRMHKIRVFVFINAI